MSDAVSTIGLGIDTGSGLTELRALRKEFQGLKQDISALNGLKADAGTLTGGTQAAKNELATLSAELKASAARVNELEQHITRLGKTQADTAKATTQVIKAEAKNQLDIQVLTANNVAKDIAAAEERTTAKIKQEAEKRYAISQSAKVNGVNYSMKTGGNESSFNTALTEAERVRREVLANSQAILIAETERAEAKRREVLANSQAILIAETDRAEALRREKLATSQTMIIAEVERSEALRREKLANSQAMQMAEIDRMDALRREKASVAQTMLIADVERAEARRREVLAVSQQMVMADIDRAEALRREKVAISQAMTIADIERAEALKREKNAVSQQMLIAEIDRAEAQKIEVARNARAMQMAEIDRADAQRREKNATAQQMLIAEIERAEARQNEVIRNARVMQMAEIDRADEIRREKNATAQQMLIAETERAETKRREVLANSQAMIMAEADRTDALRREKNQTAMQMMIADTERNEARRQAILNNNYATGSLSSRVTASKRAAGLIGDGSNAANVTLARELYGSAAITGISNLTKMEAELFASRGRGSQVTRELTDRTRTHTGAMREAHSAARGLAGGLGQLWLTYGSVVPLVAGAALTGSMVKVLEVGKDVEYQLQFLRALSDDAKKSPIDMDGFLKITDGTMASVKEAAGGMRALAQAGLDQQRALVALPNILDLAAIGELSVGQAALTATGVVHAFNLEMGEIGRVGDVFAKIASSSNTSVSAMTESMKSASTVGEMFKVSMEEAAASIGVLAQRNITGTSAGTALTTALKNMYEPTAKAKAAMDALGISTDDGHGGLKNYTQLLTELREVLSGLNDSSKAVFLGTITDQRGAKAVSAITSNLKDYKKFKEEAEQANGFMSKATLELEDTVQGAMRRISNSLEGTFIKSFQAASPSIREVMTELNHLSKSESLASVLTNIALAATNLTKILVDNAAAIGWTVAAFAGMKILSWATTGYVALRTAIATYTLTTAAATTATAGSAAVLTVQQQAAMAAGRGMIFASTGARMLAAAFGPISIAIMLAVTAYQLFKDKITDTDNAYKAANNTADTVIEYYDRQIAKLRELNQELTNNSKATANSARETAKAVLESQLSLKDEQIKAMEKNGGGKKPVSYMDKALVGDRAKTELDQARDDRKALQLKILDLENKAQEAEAGRGLNKKLNDKKGVENRLEQLIRDAGGDDADPAGTEQTKKVLLPDLLKLRTQLASSSNAYKDVAKEIVSYREKLNGMLGSFKPPHHDKTESDLYREKQAKLDGKLMGIRDDEKSKLSEVRTKVDTGEIGQLQAIAENLRIVKSARIQELDVLREKEAIAKGADKKAAAQQIDNKEKANLRANEEANREADRDRRELAARWQQDSLKSEAETLRRRGDLVKAFQAEFDAKHKLEIGGLDKDMKSGILTPTQYGQAESRKNHLERERDTGTKVATFDELQDQYDRLVGNMQEQLADVAEKASETNGFLSDIGAAQAGDDIRAKLLPEINAVVERMREVSTSLDDAGLKSSVSKMATGLIKEADRSRTAWIAAGKSIGNALGDAFGKGGKAAGGIVDALIKQHQAQKAIDSDLARNKKEDPTKLVELENKARSESAQLQISTYGQIAGAAKGFFDEQSKGYQALQAAEQVFRAFELAESIRVHVVKSGLLASFTGLFATAKTTEVGLQASTLAPTVATETAKQGVMGVTALAGALALPFPANLPAFAIVAAMLASIGVAVSGGSSGGGSGMSLSAGRQKYQGTGHAYDSANPENNPYEWELEKSESLAKSMDALRDNSSIELRYSSSQLVALESINAGISGLASMVSVTSGIRGTRADEKALGVYATHSKLGFSSSSTSLLDSGLSFNNTDIGSILNGSSVAQSYADLETKKKSFWGLSSSKNQNTQYQNLDASFADQMSLIVKGMYNSVKEAAVAFGQDGTLVEEALKAMSTADAGLSRISLKGLSTDEVEKELQGVFGQLGDTMAKTVMPGLIEFQKAGEGYMTTMIRVSSGIESAEYTLQKLGIEALKYTDVLNKQGDISTEIVRASIMHKEATAGVLSGIGQMVETFVGSASELSESYTQLNRVRRTMLATGAKDGNVTSDMVKGAGGLDNLASGMESFLENFFTEGERAAVKANMLNDEFVKLNIAMPKSKDEFKNLVEGMDRTTPAGQALYGALLNLSEGFSELSGLTGAVDPALAKQRASIDGLIETAERWMDAAREGRSRLSDIDAELAKNGGKIDNSKRIAELREMMNGTVSFEQQLELAGQIKDLVLEKYQLEKENAEKLIEFGQDLRDYVKDLRIGDKSHLTNRQKVSEAEALFQSTLKDLGSNDEKVREKAQDNIQGRADALLDVAKEYYASSENYTNIFDLVAQQLEAAGVQAESSGSKTEAAAKSQLQELKDLRVTVAGITNAIEGEFEIATQVLGTQLRVLDEMSISLGVISEVPAILRGLPAELAAIVGQKGGLNIGSGAVNGTAEEGIKGLYQELLKREADAAGLEFWLKGMKDSGTTLAQIRDLMKQSDEYKGRINGSHAAGLDYVPFDGYVAELHRGERVLTATEARRTDKASMASTASFTSPEKAEMAAEIRDLKVTLEKVTISMIEAMHRSTSNAAEKTVDGMKDAMPVQQTQPKAKII